MWQRTVKSVCQQISIFDIILFFRHTFSSAFTLKLKQLIIINGAFDKTEYKAKRYKNGILYVREFRIKKNINKFTVLYDYTIVKKVFKAFGISDMYIRRDGPYIFFLEKDVDPTWSKQ